MARHCHEKPERPQEGMIFWVNSGQFQNLSQGRQAVRWTSQEHQNCNHQSYQNESNSFLLLPI